MIPTARAVDLIAYDERGVPVLLVEVKSQHETSDIWAARFRRNILAHRSLPAALFFLIATPERMYFWREAHLQDATEPAPDHTIDTAEELKPYFEKFGETPGKVSGQALQLMVLSWLNDIAQSGRIRAKPDASLQWLSEVGLLKSLENARIDVSPM